MESRLLFFDLEVSRAVVEGYGTRWDFKPVKIIRQQELMCYAYKWQGDKKAKFVGRHDFKTYKEFVTSLADLLSSANVTVAHNGDNFDNKISNNFFMAERIDPPMPYKSIDTCKVARKMFKLPSNSLRDLADFLGLEGKREITYADLEDDYMTANPSKKTIRLMSDYTRRDVDLLEEVYMLLRPYIRNHPIMTAFTETLDACYICHSTNIRYKGEQVNRTTMYKRYKCNECKAPLRGRLAYPSIKPTVVGA